jgi:methanogenic corrinoid protein MtbC1
MNARVTLPRTVTTAKRSLRPEPGWLTIGSLARATGIPIPTLRTWERRYHLLTPKRKPSGHRLYSVASVRHLRAFRRALEAGRTPAEIMKLSVESLEALAEAEWMSRARPRGQLVARPARRIDATTLGPEVGALLDAARRFDREGLQRTLDEAWARLGPVAALEHVVAPGWKAVGEEWSAGELSIRHEHFLSQVVADFLREARHPLAEQAERAEGPWVAAATLPGDLHELGLLAAAILFSAHGWRVAYLGPNAPATEIAAFAEDAGVRVVAISVSATRRRGGGAILRALRGSLPRGIELWVGGEGSPRRVAGATVFRDLKSLDARLRG